MPVQSCESGGKPGFRWGTAGKCYTYAAGDKAAMGEAKRRAFVQGYAAGETSKMVSSEIRAARALSEHFGVVKDASTGSLMVAWYPPEDLATQLALPSGEAAKDLHLTILYLGDAEEYDVELVAAVVKVHTTWCWPLDACVTGLGRFVGEGDQDVIVALVDCARLAELRRQLQDELGCRGALDWTEFNEAAGQHGFLPHITLAYVPRTQASPAPYSEVIEFKIESLSVVAGPQRATYNFAQMENSPGQDYPATALYNYRQGAADLISKAGRVVSSANMKLLAAAKDALQALIDAEQGKDRTKKPETAPEPGGGEVAKGESLEYAVMKSVDERRYTFGPLYAPDRLDAHGEWTDGDNLQTALWDYVRESADKGRRINLQHDSSGDAEVGEWVEAVAWPYETEIEVSTPGQKARKLKMPAGTVYMGVIWDEEPWGLVKSRKITGLSLGGKAVRVADATEAAPDVHMGDKIAAAASMHKYAGDGKTCVVCAKGYEEGTHYGNADTQKAIEVVDGLESIDQVVDLLRESVASRDARHREEVAVVRASAKEERGLVSRLIEVVKDVVVERPAQPLHVHLPDQTVNINESPLDPDLPEGG